MLHSYVDDKLIFRLYTNGMEHQHELAVITRSMRHTIINCAEKPMMVGSIGKHVQDLRNDHQLFMNEKVPSVKQMYHILETAKKRAAITTLG